MGNRTTETIVRFARPFVLPSFDAPAPAGDYRIAHDEESVDGAAWNGWRRVASFIHLPALGARSTRNEMLPVEAADLEAALEKDRT